MSQSERDAVILTGVYGSGKTTVMEEMASILEERDVPYAAIDLDWLVWANIPDAHGAAGHRLMLANLAAVAANLRAAGITRFLLAGSFDNADEVGDVRATLESPVRVVRLTVPIDEIARRLAPSPTSGRHDDLEQARRDVASGAGSSLGDLVVANDRSIGDVAGEILDWLGWT